MQITLSIPSCGCPEMGTEDDYKAGLIISVQTYLEAACPLLFFVI